MADSTKFRTPFKDAVETKVPTSATKPGDATARHLPNGMPGPSPHLLPEKSYEHVDGE